MGKATDVVDDLLTRPLSAEEIRRRQEAAKPRGKLVATLDGKLVEPATTPTEQPRVVVSAPQQTWD